MKTGIFVLFIFCVSFGRSVVSVDEILDYQFDKEIKGPYNFRFTTTNGHQREETAELLHEGTEFESIFLRGSYQYIGADGKLYTVKYRADDNGFHPEGEHFEVPPFVPWPSKIDLTDTGSDTENFNKISKIPLEFLTTQRPPKFEYRPIASSTTPGRYFTTSKPIMMGGPFRNINGKRLRVTQEYVPTSTQKPKDKGDVLSSSTSRSNKISSGFKITREYIPTSSTPPNIKGDIQVSPEVFNNYINPFNQRRKMTKFSTTTNSYERIAYRVLKDDIHPTITYEGRPLEDSSFDDGFSVSIPESKKFGLRTKSRKIVSDFVTTEYPSVRVRKVDE